MVVLQPASVMPQQTSCSLLQLPLVYVMLDITLILVVFAAQYHFVLPITADAQVALSRQLLPAKPAIRLTIFKRQLLIQPIALVGLVFSSLALPAIPAVQILRMLASHAFLPQFVSPAKLTLLSLKANAPAFRNTTSTLLILATYAKLDV